MAITLLDLPPEILAMIFGKRGLNLRELGTVSLMHSHLRRVMIDPVYHYQYRIQFEHLYRKLSRADKEAIVDSEGGWAEKFKTTVKQQYGKLNGKALNLIFAAKQGPEYFQDELVSQIKELLTKSDYVDDTTDNDNLIFTIINAAIYSLNILDSDVETALLRDAAIQGHEINQNNPIVADIFETAGWLHAVESNNISILYWAANMGHTAAVEEFSKPKNVRIKLFAAAKIGHDRLVQQLIKDNKSLVNELDNQGYNALHYAAENDHDKVAETLLNNNVQVNIKVGSSTKTPLLLAAKNGHLKTVNTLLKYKANVDEILLTLIEHICQPNCANKVKAFRILEVLLSNGASIAAKNTALHAAAIRNHCNIIEILLREGANIDEKQNNGKTALQLAIRYSNLEAVNVLLKNNANIDAKDSRNCTPLTYAFHNLKHNLHVMGESVINDTNIAQALLYSGAESDKYDLFRAAEDGVCSIVGLLLRNGTDVDEKDDDTDETALHLAAEKGYCKVVELLLGRGANVHARDNNGETALHSATKHGNCQNIRLCHPHRTRTDGHCHVIEILLRNGADVNATDNDGKTALHWAAEIGSICDASPFWTDRSFYVVEILLRNSADVNIKTVAGETAAEVTEIDKIKILLTTKMANQATQSTTMLFASPNSSGKSRDDSDTPPTTLRKSQKLGYNH